MTQETKKLPIYSQIWNKIKQFPGVLSQGSENPPTSSGPAAATLISGGMGVVTMMITHHISETNQNVETILHKVVGAWIPGTMNRDPMWGNIGSYAGKETIMLISWLGSWVILHFLLKDRQIRPRTLFFWMFSLFTLATVMAWHPLFPYLPIM